MKKELAREDKNGNFIGDGSYNIPVSVLEFVNYPQITSKVSNSLTTESAYVTYTNTDNQKSVTCRFSYHENNGVKCGDELNGFIASENEILYRLGLKNRVFVPETYLNIWKESVAKKKLAQYEESDLTISEMYDLGEGADLSAYKGKLAKGSNYLILGDKVEKSFRTTLNWLGTEVRVGRFIYE